MEPMEQKSTDAKAAAVSAFRHFTWRQVKFSRPVRKRIEHNAPITFKGAMMVLEETSHELLLDLKSWVLSSTNTMIVHNQLNYPATWVQHLKKAIYDRLPDPLAAWLDRKLPVRMHSEDVPFEQHIRVCPHSNFPQSSRRHAQWMCEQGEGMDQLLDSYQGVLAALKTILEADYDPFTRERWTSEYVAARVEAGALIKKAEALLEVKTQARALAVAANRENQASSDAH